VTDTPKRFEDWEKVDCNECARYWDSSCDGVTKGSEKPCNSFLATRSVVIPARLKTLEKRVRWLIVIIACMVGVDVCALIGVLLFG
jgi:hypothetical protein